MEVVCTVRLADGTNRAFTAAAAFPALNTPVVITCAWEPVAGNASDCSIYIDGVPKVVTLNTPYTPQALAVGASTILFNNDGFSGATGYYDDALLFPSKLTQFQIQNLIAAT